MGRWLRHHPGDVGLTARATTQECTQIGQNGLSAPFWSVCVHCWAVALLWTDVGTQECTQIGQKGLSAPFWGICVHCCDASHDTNRDASCARWHERLSRHGVPAAPPRWPLSLGREDRLCASGAAARLAFWPRRQPTRTPEEPSFPVPTRRKPAPARQAGDREFVARLDPRVLVVGSIRIGDC